MHAATVAARIERAADLIEHRFGEELTLEALAASACYSPHHFVRAFTAHTGMRPFDALRKRRLHVAAQQLLTHPETDITDIALACGFAYATSFAKRFRQHFDMNAQAWRAGGWRDWMGTLSHQLDASHPHHLEYLFARSRQHALPTVVRLPAMTQHVRRWRGTWGRQLQNEALPAMVALETAFGARSDLLGLRAANEATFDLCASTPFDGAASQRTLPGGLYGCYALDRNTTSYLSWREIVLGWPASHRLAPDPTRPKLEFYEYGHCRALYLPLCPR
ncbi:helix-turn-helix transcriptional regulator [Chitinibacteraceae bacterium HSL-7]